MRTILLSFVGFAICCGLLLPQLNDSVELPVNFIKYAPVALMVILLLVQVDGILLMKKMHRYPQLIEKNNQLSIQVKETSDKCDLTLKNINELSEELALSKSTIELKENDISALRTENHESLIKYEKAIKDVQNKLEQIKLDKDSIKNQQNSEAQMIQLLTLLQDKGRFLDFIMDDVTAYPDDQVGAASRIVHSGCKKVLNEYFEIGPIRKEEEGSTVILDKHNYEPESHKLIGHVGTPPFKGTVLHRGWKINQINLPELIGDQIVSRMKILSPAEIELS